MKTAITLLAAVLAMAILAGSASAAITCSVALSATTIFGASEDITVTCSGITSGSVTITPSVGSEAYFGSCLSVSPSSYSVSQSSPSATFSVEGTYLACSGNGKKVTWTFTGTGAPASKTTTYNILPGLPSITPTFMNTTYTITNETTALEVTLQLTSSQNAVDIRGVTVTLITELDGVNGTLNKTDITIDVSESTTQYVTWNLQMPPLPPGMSYDFNVSISSENANDASANTIINITTPSGEQTTLVSLGLVSGWNLVSLPVQPDNRSITAVMSTVSSLDEVWIYNASAPYIWQKWKFYSTNPEYPPELITLTVLDEMFGIWVKTTSTDQLNVTGTIPSSFSMPLVSGWNLVGYPSSTERNVTYAMGSVSGNWDDVWLYNASATYIWQKWKLYSSNPEYPPELNTLVNMVYGFGYWINMNTADTWTVE